MKCLGTRVEEQAISFNTEVEEQGLETSVEGQGMRNKGLETRAEE